METISTTIEQTTSASPHRAPETHRAPPWWTVVVPLLLAALLVVGGVVGVLHLGASDPTTPRAAPVPDAVLPDLTEPAPALAALDPAAPQPTALDSTLAPLLADPALGTGLSAQVVDALTGTVLFDRDGTDPGTPASTAKLLTATAVLTTLDPTSTLPTTVVAGAQPGQVVLVGGGDPTLSSSGPSRTYDGAATIDDLAAQVRATLGGAAVTSVVVDSSLFSGPLTAAGWGDDDAPSSYAAPVTAVAVDGARQSPGSSARSGQPARDAGAALATALGAPAAAVSAGAAPAGAAVLGQVQSAPIVRLVEQTLEQSDNLLAEVLARQVAIARGEPATFAGAARAVTDAVAAADVDVTGVTLGDGSGLSAGDRVPAATLVDLLRAAADGTLPAAADLLSGLPIAGYTGTLADRGDADADSAPGEVRAKTGTLLSVNALAGTVVTADGRLLVFAVLADGASPVVDDAEAALDRIANALAGCGC